MNTLANRQTAAQLADNYQKACIKMAAGYQALKDAQDILERSFGVYNHYGDFDVINHGTILRMTPVDQVIEAVQKKLRKAAWFTIYNLLEIDKLASVKRWEEIQEKLKTGDDLPEITAQSILDLVLSFQQNADDMLREMILEVYDNLRPRGTNYKTNSKFDIGKKVILEWRVEPYGKSFRVHFNHYKELQALDRVFAALDGKPLEQDHSYTCPLREAIETSLTGVGETDYFKFKACINKNLHLEFKRPDLVARLNAIAGGMNLREG